MDPFGFFSFIFLCAKMRSHTACCQRGGHFGWTAGKHIHTQAGRHPATLQYTFQIFTRKKSHSKPNILKWIPKWFHSPIDVRSGSESDKCFVRMERWMNTADVSAFDKHFVTFWFSVRMENVRTVVGSVDGVCASAILGCWMACARLAFSMRSMWACVARCASQRCRSACRMDIRTANGTTGAGSGISSEYQMIVHYNEIHRNKNETCLEVHISAFGTKMFLPWTQATTSVAVVCHPHHCSFLVLSAHSNFFHR